MTTTVKITTGQSRAQVTVNTSYNEPGLTRSVHENHVIAASDEKTLTVSLGAHLTVVELADETVTAPAP